MNKQYSSSCYSTTRLQVFRGQFVLFDTGCLYDKSLKGGKVGLFVFSQESVVWSDTRIRCNGMYLLTQNIFETSLKVFYK